MKLRKVLSLFVALVMMLEVLPLSSLATEIADATENVEVSAEVVSEEIEPEEVAEDSDVSDDAGTSSEAEEVIEEAIEEESTILLGASASDADEDSSDESGIATVSEDATTVASGTCGDDLTWVLDSDGVLTISGTGDMTYYSSTSSVPWYSRRSSIISVVIESGVTSIGNYAFRNCTILESVAIPDSVTSIAGSAFIGCSNLMGIDVSSGNTKYLSLDGILFSIDMSVLVYYPFAKGDTSMAYVVPGTVTSIEDYAFYGSTSLTSVTFSGNVTSIGDYAFYNCTSLTNMIIPSSVKSIGERAFMGCISLTSIDIPGGVRSIGNGVFYGCSGLISITIPDSVTSIDMWAFMGCTSLTGIDIPDSVTKIGNHAFEGCTSLISVTIPGSVTSMGVNIFSDCTGLTSVTIDNGVKSVGSYAFSDCTSLTTVTIGDSVTNIYNYAFYGCTSLESVVIPDSVTSIGEEAFADCTGLTSASLGNGVISIGRFAFYNCTSLTSLAIPDSVTNIGIGAFNNCTDLLSVLIGNSVTDIGDGAFYKCTSLKSLIIPANVISIGEEAFSYCTGLKSVNIGDGVTSIGNYAFHTCYSLTSVTIPDSVTSIGNGIFSGCTSLASVTIPDSVTSIGKYAFSNCTSLTNITIPDSVINIGERAFQDCTGLTSIVIANSVGNIDKYAFYYCSNLTDVYYGGTESEWNEISIATTGNSNLLNATIHYSELDDEAPVAIINPTFLVAGTGVDFQFSGTSSTDNVGVATYYWNFGDGSTSGDSAPLHTYSAAGTYTVSLTVADASGNSDIVQAEIQVVDVDEDSDYAIVEFTVVDSSTTGIVSGAIMQVGQVVDDDGNCEIIAQLESDSTGYAVAVLEKGTYNISVTASSYMPKTVVVNVNESGEYTIAISTTSLVVGEITATEMTYDEIVDAGIDVDAEENQHVWKFEATFTFTVGLETFDVSTILGYSSSSSSSSGSGSYIASEGGWHSCSSSSGALYTFGIFPMMTEGFCLVVYGEAHWLKEMYNVELIVMNESQVETIEDCAATLSLPEGMSLATMVSDQQSLTIDLGTIGTDETSTATWYLCGDEEGEYYLTADVAGNWVTGNISSAFSETFTTSEPVKVYAGTALHLYIEADDVATRGEGYKVTFRLENVSDKSLYNLTFGVTNVEQYKTISASYDGVSWSGDAAITSADFDDSMMRTVSELAPGGYIEITIEVTCWFNSIAELAEVVLDTTLKSELPVGGSVLASLVNIVYYLQDVQVVTLEGSTTSIPYSFSIKETDKDNLVDVIIKNAANEVLDKAFGIDTGGTLGATLIKVIGKEVGVDADLISGAKAILSLAQGETDYTFEISMDDGLQEGDSISNEYLTVTFGTPQSAVWDTLNGTKVTYKGGDITIQAKLPGSTSLKIAVKNSLGDLETELTFNVTTEDTVLKDKITLSQDETKGSFRLDENSLDITVNKNVREIREVIDELLAAQLNVYESNPFAYFDSELIIDVSGTTSDNSFDYTLNTDLDVINGSSGGGFRSSTATTSSGGFRNSTATTLYTISNGSSLVSFSADAFYDIADTTSDGGDSEFTLATTRLSVEEAALFGFGEDTYSFDITTESGTEISDFGGNEVTITLPYVLPDGADADDIVVIHLNENNWTYETIDATYDEEAQTVTFVTTHFSIYSIDVISCDDESSSVDISEAENGTVTTNVSEAEEGDTVTVSITPDDGYTVGEVTVIDENGDKVEVTDNGDGTYSFTMPEGEVAITVTFEADNEDNPGTTHTHTAGSTVRENVVAATATTNGSYDLVTYCTVCGEELSRTTVIVPATGMVDVWLATSADYSAVNNAIAKANALNSEDYTNFSDVTDAISAVNWTYNALMQSYVNEMAEKIETAIANLIPVGMTTEEVEIQEPIESTNTDTEDDDEESSETSEPESNPTTGIAISILPMMIAALAVASAKRR
ncbi:MAG: leucine-rich repeat protein [Oscillospiraceae bacterium]|nr:leucine-rich repeat protein [Oscillospiraceae bacterium]